MSAGPIDPLTDRIHGLAAEPGTSRIVGAAHRRTDADADAEFDTPRVEVPRIQTDRERVRLGLEAIAAAAAAKEAFGFELVHEIGRGAFGRVYLARQTDLGGRPVALKLSADLTGESRTLARLQHTNIVPVYSVHKAAVLHGVCMPYFGPTTLNTLLRHFRGQNRLPTTGREFVDTFQGLSTRPTGPAEDPPATDPAMSTAGTTDAVLRLLAGGSYERAVCWLAARLADGLAHAHDRGIIHRDIKPANILLTDDGQPMLLDFGVAAEIKAKAAAGGTAGTIPYMAPEQLDEMYADRARIDPRADLYSFGVVLYELLTGRFPFRPPAAAAADVPGMIAERRAAPPSVRTHNPAVTPGLESIVHTLLAGDPDKRYPSAAALRDDLERYLSDRPLATAPEPSTKERLAKWSRRNPKLTSNATLGAVAVVLLLAGGTAAAVHQDRLARLEAEQTYRQFEAESKTAQYMLFARIDDRRTLERGLAAGKAALDRYGVLTAADWETKPAFAALPAADQPRVRQEIAQAVLLLARAYGSKGVSATNPDPAALAEAIRLNALAETLFAGQSPKILFTQRATQMKAAGKLDESAAAAKLAADTPPRSARDHYLVGVDEQAAGRHQQAIAAFRTAQAMDPKMFWAYFGEGVSHDVQGRTADARGCYTAAVALGPEFHWAHYNRGVSRLRAGELADAAADLTRAIALDPEFGEAYLARAMVRSATDKPAARADLASAAANGVPADRIAQARDQIDPPAAGEPTDEAGWIRRGLSRMGTDKVAALADFEQAAKRYPTSVSALLHVGYARSELERHADAGRAYDKVLELAPTNVMAFSARSIVRLRQGKGAEAVSDARAALQHGFSPAVAYQAAGVFASLSKAEPAYRAEAMLLLGIALRSGFGFEYEPTDKELDPIRESPEYRKLLADCETFRPKAGK